MAILTNNSSGNFTTAATWSVIDPTAFATLIATQELGSSVTITSFVSGVAFTPGAITIDGIGIKIATRTASGTISVRLIQSATPVAGTTVTINAADIQAGVGWIFLKFAAPVTLVAATAYNVQATGSVASNATIQRKSATASDWTFYLRTTTTQAPAASDTFIITGDWISAGVNNSYTVTMDNTTSATTFGANVIGQPSIEVNDKGTLAYGSAASTAYYLKLAGTTYLNINGTLTIGTAGSPVPSTSSAVLEFTEPLNVQYGVIARGSLCTLTTYGATKTGRAYLASSGVLAAGATSLTTDISTGWLASDVIAIATTTRTIAQSETVTVGVGGATGTTVPVSATAFPHDGSSTTPLKAEIINLTRNVRICGASITNQAYINISSTTGTISFNYTEFQWMGSATATFRGIDTATTTGSFSIVGCALKNFEVVSSAGVNITSAAATNCVVSDTVFYRIAVASIVTAAYVSATNIINNCWSIGGTSMGTTAQFSFSSTSGTFTNINAAGSATIGISISGNDLVNFTASNWIAHSCGTSNIQITGSTTLTAPSVITNLTAYRGNARGILLSTLINTKIDTVVAFGNLTNGIEFNSTYDCEVSNGSIYSDAALAQTIGVAFTASGANCVVSSSVFGAGGLTHSTGDIAVSTARSYHSAILRNCLLNSTIEIALQGNLSPTGFIASARNDQTAGQHKMWKKYGTMTLDSSFFVVAAPSQRMTPNSATGKLNTIEKKVAVPNGKAVKISVYVRKSVVGDGAAYNGNFPRLILRGDAATGLATDTVLATATAASVGAFELITATTSAVTDDVALKFYVDCDGTAGWANIDRWLVEVV